jgi:hypothetical protein
LSTQLGVDNNTAIRVGGLSGDSLFFGSGTSEILSVNIARGGWNGDRDYSVGTAYPWFYNGGVANSSSGAGAGVFSFEWHDGVALAPVSHRTILSGY